MELQDFRGILTSFADSPADIDLSRGVLVVQIMEELIEAKLIQRHGTLYVVENEAEIPALQWLVQRVARLPLLADRILSNVHNDPNFVTPAGDLLDQIDYSPSDVDVCVSDASAKVIEILGRRFAGTASVLYLTSDAGEGKTTLITQLARMQAQRYKEKKTDWLLVPVSLGGRTFMRFDDVIIGALVNRLRFSFLYHESFIELVKLGVLIPAFDGFEEMFVEGSSGDAISALGNLVHALKSSGTVLIAARKAYFEYKNLHSQTRLFDSLGGQSVAFARIALRRWDQSHFLQYARNRKVTNAEGIYDDVATKLSPAHPLLTRAVLVKRLLDVAAQLEDRSRLLANIESNPNDYFRQFIGSIISREATEKWIDKKGEVAQPLISEDEHYELLSLIALEMWNNGTEVLRSDILELVTEVFADSRKKDKVITYQVIERIKQHALIVGVDSHSFAFDHPEFYHFFLGEAVGRLIVRGYKPDISYAFRQGVLPSFAIEAAAKSAQRYGASIMALIEIVNEICIAEPRASFIKENLSGIIIRLIDYGNFQAATVAQGSFPPDSMAGRQLTGLIFQNCYFQGTSLAHTTLRHCRFTSCEFESLILDETLDVDNCIFIECEIRSVLPVGSETAVYAPQHVRDALLSAGFGFHTIPQDQPQALAPPDDELVLVGRMLRAFLRATGVNENTLRNRLGTQASSFFKEVLPPLMEAGIVVEVPFRGSGAQQRFQLGVPLERLNRAIEDCGGVFTRFIELAR